MTQTRIMMITAYLAEDHVYIADQIESLLGASPEIELLGIASNGVALFEGIEQTQPDILLLDLQMPSGMGKKRFNPLKALQKIGEITPKTMILIITGRKSIPLLMSAMSNNGCVRGYILKDDQDSRELPAIIKHVAGGNTYFSETVRIDLSNRPLNQIHPDLTKRHLEIVLEMATNSDAPQTAHAEALAISVNTLKSHLAQIYNILGVKNRPSCILRCLQLGYLPISVIDFDLSEVSREEAWS